MKSNKLLLSVIMGISVIGCAAIGLYAGVADMADHTKGSTLYNIAMILTYIFMFVSVAAMLIFPVWFIIKNPKTAKGTLVGVAILAVVMLIAYLISSPDQGEFYTKFDITGSGSKLIGAGLIATYIMLFGVIAVMIYAAVAERFKKI